MSDFVPMPTRAGDLIHQVAASGARRVTMFVDPKTTIVVARRHRPDRRARSQEFLVTIGVPNYRNRQSIKRYKKLSGQFPANVTEFTDWPKKKRG